MTYIVLLRGINVAGKNKIIMKEFVKTLSNNDEFDSVKSYIQSGNFIINSSINDTNILSLKIQKIIQKEYEYTVDVFSFSLSEFTKIVELHPYSIKEKRNYIAFLNEQPDLTKIETLNNKDFRGDLYKIDKNAIHLQFELQYSKSKLNNNYLEKQLNIKSTMRNWNTVQKLISLAEKQ